MKVKVKCTTGRLCTNTQTANTEKQSHVHGITFQILLKIAHSQGVVVVPVYFSTLWRIRRQLHLKTRTLWHEIIAPTHPPTQMQTHARTYTPPPNKSVNINTKTAVVIAAGRLIHHDSCSTVSEHHNLHTDHNLHSVQP